MKEFMHPFLNPYNLSSAQIIFWVILCAVVVPILGWLTGRLFQ